MPKNIVIRCGETGNEFNPQSNSNVVKLCSTLVINQCAAAAHSRDGALAIGGTEDYRPQNPPILPPKETDEPWVRYP